MQPHQERVVTEQAELADKLEKLQRFITHTGTFADLPQTEQHRLIRQADYMKAYNQVLVERIEAFQ